MKFVVVAWCSCCTAGIGGASYLSCCTLRVCYCLYVMLFPTAVLRGSACLACCSCAVELHSMREAPNLHYKTSFLNFVKSDSSAPYNDTTEIVLTSSPFFSRVKLYY